MENHLFSHLYRNPNSHNTMPNYPLFGSPVFKPMPTHSTRPELTRPKSAIIIQKAFRGFRVRKTLRNILSIQQQVDEIAHDFKHKTNFTVNNSKENIKHKELLMALLLKLDSISGVDVGVRNIRKSVINEIVTLQKSMDECVDDTWQCVEDKWKVNEDEWLMVGSKDGEVDDKKKLVGLMSKLVKMNNEQMGLIEELFDRLNMVEAAVKDRVNKDTSSGKVNNGEYESLMNRVKELEKKMKKKKKNDNAC